MDLRPLPGKVLIQPDAAPTVSEGGIHLVDHWPQEVSGTVIAVGDGRHPKRDEAYDVAGELYAFRDRAPKQYARADLCEKAAQLLRALGGREPSVTVGDRVLFGPSAGQEVRINDTRYFLMTDTDVLAVME